LLTSCTLSLSEARRIALAAQGFDRPRPRGAVRAEHIRSVIRQLGLVQLDFVNVVIPAHFTVLFSRLGPYDKRLFEEVAYGGEFTEQWAHEASIVPVATWPLLRYRMERHRIWPRGFSAFLEKHADYATWVLQEVGRRGATLAEDLPVPDGVERRIPGTWARTVPRATLEAHFGRGLLGVAARQQNFARLYDLAERLVPREHHSRHVEAAEAQRELLRHAARAHGIGTTADLADYYRMPIREARPRLAELAEAGEIVEVEVDGRRAWLHKDARAPRSIDAVTLLAPFDPLLWYRPRVRWLFGFDYRVEIFVPKPQRRWGHYVLPFLLGERLVARVDLKANRAARSLDALAAYLEPGIPADEVVKPLGVELGTFAEWLGLESVKVGRRGNLSQALRRMVDI
jgi:uncharacterized protein